MKKFKVIFFGRSNCELTTYANQFLKFLGFDVLKICTSSRGKILLKDLTWKSCDYIFSFRNLKVISSEVLKIAKISCINFHPGPPNYPGSGCINFALINNENYFGVTAHHMTPKVDEGEIIKFNKFKIHSYDNVEILLYKTHVKLLDLFIDVVSDVINKSKNKIKIKKNKKYKWTGSKKPITEIDKLSTINFDIQEKKLKNIIRSFHTKKFPIKIHLHGYEFHLKN